MSLLNNTLLSMFLLLSIIMLAFELYSVLMVMRMAGEEEDTDDEK